MGHELKYFRHSWSGFCVRSNARRSKDGEEGRSDRGQHSGYWRDWYRQGIIAKTIDEYSRRSALPFLALNCAACPEGPFGKSAVWP